MRANLDGNATVLGDQLCVAVVSAHDESVSRLTPRATRYVTEFANRHNVRELDTLDQMVLLARMMVGKRLRYDDLVAEA